MKLIERNSFFSLKYEERVLVVANYMIDNKATIRATAKEFGIARQTVFNYVRNKLEGIDEETYKLAIEVLLENKGARYRRGAVAMLKLKYNK